MKGGNVIIRAYMIKSSKFIDIWGNEEQISAVRNGLKWIETAVEARAGFGPCQKQTVYGFYILFAAIGLGIQIRLSLLIFDLFLSLPTPKLGVWPRQPPVSPAVPKRTWQDLCEVFICYRLIIRPFHIIWNINYYSNYRCCSEQYITVIVACLWLLLPMMFLRLTLLWIDVVLFSIIKILSL